MLTAGGILSSNVGFLIQYFHRLTYFEVLEFDSSEVHFFFEFPDSSHDLQKYFVLAFPSCFGFDFLDYAQ